MTAEEIKIKEETGNLPGSRGEALPEEYIVLDLEWNQAPIWEQMRGRSSSISGEIIEIGAVRVLPSGERKDCFKSLVKPKYFKKMNEKVAQITGITTSVLEDAPFFSEAFARFLAFCGEGKRLALLTWGPDDIPMLRANMKLNGIEEGLLPPSYDLQKIFNRQITGEKRQWALGDAVDLLELPKEWTAHDALHDALYTALVAGKLRLNEGIAAYGEGDAVLERRSVTGARHWREIFQAREIAEFCCPACGSGRRIAPEAWYFKNAGQKLTEYRCGCGKTYLLRCKFHKNKMGIYTAVRTVSEMDEEGRNALEKAMEKEKARKAAFASSAKNREIKES